MPRAITGRSPGAEGLGVLCSWACWSTGSHYGDQSGAVECKGLASLHCPLPTQQYRCHAAILLHGHGPPIRPIHMPSEFYTGLGVYWRSVMVTIKPESIHRDSYKWFWEFGSVSAKFGCMKFVKDLRN